MSLLGKAETKRELQGNIESGGTLNGNALGLKTIRGYSAYEIAVLNGFRGTEEEWLETLIGESAYEGAVSCGYKGTEEEFYADLALFEERALAAKEAEQNAKIYEERASSSAEQAASSAESANAAKEGLVEAEQNAKASENAAKEAQTAAEKARDEAQAAVGGDFASKQMVEDHIADKNNPHGVTATQVGARPNTWTPTAADVGARPNTWMPTASDVGAAASSHNHAAGDITSGTLPISRGGTGATSAANARSKLGVPEYEEGTWTPTDVNNFGLIFSTVTRNYTKIGRFVNVILKLKVPSETKGRTIKIGGLPFNTNVTYGSPVGEWADCYNCTINASGIVTCLGADDSYNIVLKNHNDTSVKDSDLGASHDITISLHYQVV